MTRFRQVVFALSLALFASACAASFGRSRIADVRSNPGRYQRQSVNIEGVVTTSWGIPLAPFALYKVDDGTGELTVVSQGRDLPTRGAHVRVRGRVDELAVFGGQAVGLHLTEEALRVDR